MKIMLCYMQCCYFINVSIKSNHVSFVLLEAGGVVLWVWFFAPFVLLMGCVCEDISIPLLSHA